ncbi:MAG: hypothetical protein HQK53_19860, partial [Oligoflexia bacterium]|nr:hypothetical protein [Oligoflexia bacterium]
MVKNINLSMRASASWALAILYGQLLFSGCSVNATHATNATNEIPGPSVIKIVKTDEELFDNLRDIDQ